MATIRCYLPVGGFWERFLRAADTSGRSGQLRTQLRIVLDATKSVAHRELGVAVAGDRVYDDLETSLQHTGALAPVTARLIASLDDGTEDGRLAARVAKVVYLIGRLPTDGPLSAGIRATSDTIADLLVEDLAKDGARLRERVPEALKTLVARSVVQELGVAYILQTPEGAEWDAEYRAHEQDLSTDSRWQAERRDQLLREAFAEMDRSLRPKQGTSQAIRKVKAHFGADEPPESADIPIWIRDEWSASERVVREDAQRLDTSSPVVVVWVPRHYAEELMAAMVEAQASERTVERRAVPATQEGRDARQGLISRREDARSREKAVAKQVLSRARVYQAGGNEITEGSGSDTFEKSLRRAVDNAVLRLFPDFGPADHARWDTVLKRVREGSAEPFAPVGHRGELNDHPVAKQVLAYLGHAGKRGTDVRKHFESPPFGWSQDAVDATLLALVASGSAQGRYAGAPIEPSRIPQNQIGSADYRSESVTVRISDRMRLRGLAGNLGATVGTAPDGELAALVLARLRELANEAGGDSPLPAKPWSDGLRELEGESGNPQLLAIANAKDKLEALASEWSVRAASVPERRRAWDVAQRLLRHATVMPSHNVAKGQLDAIATERTLLDDPDPVAPISTLLADDLRSALAGQLETFRVARDDGLEQIHANPGWATLDSAQQSEILARAGLAERGVEEVGTNEGLLRALDAIPLPDWGYRVDAVSTQVHKVQIEIARLTTKAPTPVSLPKAIVTDAADLERYFEEVRTLVQPHLDKDETVAI